MELNPTLRSRMESRYLTAGEDFREAWQILKKRISYYGFLMLLVYLPIQAVLQYQTAQLDLSVEATELLLSQLGRLGIVEVVITLLEQVAILVVAVIVAYEIDPDQSDVPFSTIFYRGVRMWPRAILTLVLVIFGAVCAMSAAVTLLLVPLIGLVAVAGVMLLAILLVLLQSCTGTAAALRGRMGFDNIRYVFFVLQGRMWRTMGTFAMITLLSTVLQLLISFALDALFAGISQPVVSMVISILISTGLSIITLYGYTVGAVLFVGAEIRKEKVLTEQQQI